MSCAVVKNEIILFGQMRFVGRNETLEPTLGRCIVIKILSPEMIIDAQVAQCGGASAPCETLEVQTTL